MKKVFIIIFILFLVGCSNEKKLDCTLSLETNDFKENWNFSFTFEKGILENYSNTSTSSKLYVPKTLQIPVKVNDSKNLKVGDVVAFKDKESEAEVILVHRIIDIVDVDGSNYFITKRDDFDTQDKNLLSSDDVLFQNLESIDDLNEKSYDSVKDYFEEKGYSCK